MIMKKEKAEDENLLQIHGDSVYSKNPGALFRDAEFNNKKALDADWSKHKWIRVKDIKSDHGK